MQKHGLGRGLSALIPENRQPTPDANTAVEADGGVRQIPVAQVEANPYQPRTLFDPEKMADLVASVREHGILQPILVRKMAPERYQLVAGERRFRAAERAGLSKGEQTDFVCRPRRIRSCRPTPRQRSRKPRCRTPAATCREAIYRARRPPCARRCRCCCS